MTFDQEKLQNGENTSEACSLIVISNLLGDLIEDGKISKNELLNLLSQRAQQASQSSLDINNMQDSKTGDATQITAQSKPEEVKTPSKKVIEEEKYNKMSR